MIKNGLIVILLLVLISGFGYCATTAAVQNVKILQYPGYAAVGSQVALTVNLACQANSTDSADTTVLNTTFKTYKNGVLVRTYIFNGTGNGYYLNITNFAVNGVSSDTYKCGVIATDALGVNTVESYSAVVTYEPTAPDLIDAVYSLLIGVLRGISENAFTLVGLIVLGVVSYLARGFFKDIFAIFSGMKKDGVKK